MAEAFDSVARFALEGMKARAKAAATYKDTGKAETRTTRVSYYPVSQAYGYFTPDGACTVSKILAALALEASAADPRLAGRRPRQLANDKR